MKISLLLFWSAFTLFLVGCMSEELNTKTTPAESSDDSSYCFVGMD